MTHFHPGFILLNTPFGLSSLLHASPHRSPHEVRVWSSPLGQQRRPGTEGGWQSKVTLLGSGSLSPGPRPLCPIQQVVSLSILSQFGFSKVGDLQSVFTWRNVVCMDGVLGCVAWSLRNQLTFTECSLLVRDREENVTSTVSAPYREGPWKVDISVHRLQMVGWSLAGVKGRIVNRWKTEIRAQGLVWLPLS